MQCNVSTVNGPQMRLLKLFHVPLFWKGLFLGRKREKPGLKVAIEIENQRRKEEDFFSILFIKYLFLQALLLSHVSVRKNNHTSIPTDRRKQGRKASFVIFFLSFILLSFCLRRGRRRRRWWFKRFLLFHTLCRRRKAGFQTFTFQFKSFFATDQQSTQWGEERRGICSSSSKLIGFLFRQMLQFFRQRVNDEKYNQSVHLFMYVCLLLHHITT